ncbi:hypothetical protein CRI94_16055 [Longibacter salinarum]|uniref:Uncharacterized protein n=1 Tax=Longibacter salinarum TaxID=1850348 RepID=A0A2A8CTT6_9BACT|nr:hypothetical protein [Longibacter salinarum]PEN11302.1 hypothetical protein CRI94_16055 [Longibacter salinarum]
MPRPSTLSSHELLRQEALALLDRLSRVKPFALLMPMTPAAAPGPVTQQAIERYLVQGRKHLRRRVEEYLRWLDSPTGRRTSANRAHGRFVHLKLMFNRVLTQFDLFADVLTQRSEHDHGARLGGLDTVAARALALPGAPYRPPPVLCYLDRGQGAAIRRARTRLPGGGRNPVAIIRVPRERMIGSGIASSLLHEVGHQGAALLDLVSSIRYDLNRRSRSEAIWIYWERWISEIIADLWAIAQLGVGSTLGLMGVVALPRAFVFRLGADDPHPPPWVRVLLSCEMGRQLFPDPQWDRLEASWHRYYPLREARKRERNVFAAVHRHMPTFVRALRSHRPARMKGRALETLFPVPERQPRLFRSLWPRWQGDVEQMIRHDPSLVFAVLGQAKADGRISADAEGQLLARLLNYWALRSTLHPDRTRLPKEIPKAPTH